MTTTDPYQVCIECGRVYATATDLLLEYRKEMPDIPECERPEWTSVANVLFCPNCVADFVYPPRPSLAGELPAQAAVLAECLQRNGFDPTRAIERNVIKLGEEAGEVAGAYLRCTGQARRTGTTAELHEEVADVILTVFSLAHHLDMDLNAVLAAKLRTIHTRGYRDNPTGGERR